MPPRFSRTPDDSWFGNLDREFSFADLKDLLGIGALEPTLPPGVTEGPGLGQPDHAVLSHSHIAQVTPDGPGFGTNGPREGLVPTFQGAAGGPKADLSAELGFGVGQLDPTWATKPESEGSGFGDALLDAFGDLDDAFSPLRPEGPRGARIGILDEGVKIQNFILSKRGVDREENSYVELLHDGDEVVLRVPPEYAEATFVVAKRVKISKRNIWGKAAGTKSDKTTTDTFTLPTSGTRTINVSEGRKNVPLARDEILNVDVSVTLDRAKRIKTDSSGRTTTETVTSESGGGAGRGAGEAAELTREDMLKYGGIAAVGIAILAGAGYLITRDRPAPPKGG